MIGCVMNPEVHQNPLTKTTSKMRDDSREICEELFDVWRTLRNKESDHAFFFFFTSTPKFLSNRLLFVSRMVLDGVE